MNRIILVAHGNLAEGMKNSAELIFGKLPQISTIEFPKEEGFDGISAKILKAVEQDHNPVLIMTDLFGGTPYNASCAICLKKKEQDIEVVSGMSLPLLLEASSMLSTFEMNKLVKKIKELSTETVKFFSEQAIDDEEDL